MATEVGGITFGDGVGMFAKEVINVVADFPEGSEEIKGGHLVVGCCIREVVGICTSDVGGHFGDGWAKIIVCGHNNKHIGVAEGTKEVLLIWQQVPCATAQAESFFESSEEVGDPGTEFDGNIFNRGVPVLGGEV